MYKKKCAARAKLLFLLIGPIVVFDTHYVWTACVYTGNPGSVIVPQYGSIVKLQCLYGVKIRSQNL